MRDHGCIIIILFVYFLLGKKIDRTRASIYYVSTVLAKKKKIVTNFSYKYLTNIITRKIKNYENKKLRIKNF